MPVSEFRNVEQVQHLIELAKLDKSDLEGSTQTLYLPPELSSENVVLMEVNSKLLNHLAQGKSLILRGGKDDTAVMCTDDDTYDVREAATSNSLLLVPGLDLPGRSISAETHILIPREINGIFSTYLEPKECQPKLSKLRKMLEENVYLGPEYETDNDKPKYMLEDLFSEIQATESQLMKGLADIPAYLINGYYRTLDFDYHWRIFNFIINLVDSNSWPTDKVPREETIATLEELAPREILQQCFDQFCVQNKKEGDLYRLLEDKVCRFYAEVLLRNAGKFHRDEFLKVWQTSVPEGMTTDLAYLKGVALEDCTSKPEVIFFFPVWKLPDDIPGRLDALFNVKEKWTYEEIEPYVQELASASLSTSALLTKFARSSVKNGVRLFSSKYPLRK